jgi:hypothetical protein
MSIAYLDIEDFAIKDDFHSPFLINTGNTRLKF